MHAIENILYYYRDSPVQSLVDLSNSNKYSYFETLLKLSSCCSCKFLESEKAPLKLKSEHAI